jgi:NADH dehydrogenase
LRSPPSGKVAASTDSTIRGGGGARVQLTPEDGIMASPRDPHHVVIIGGGFGGLRTAQGLGQVAGVRVTLVDRRNFHLFQPLLYQVATGALSPSNIATPLRSLVKRQRNTEVILDEMTGLDMASRTVQLLQGRVPFDSLVVATGSRQHYFGHPQWEELAPGLKSIEDATRMRHRILATLEAAERSEDPQQRARLMTFVVVGGGPTSVELAGALAEIARHALIGEFRRMNPADIRIVVVQAAARVLPSFPEKLSQRAQAAMASLGIDVRVDTHVTGIHADHVDLSGPSGTQRLDCACILWGAGVIGSPVGRLVATATGSTLDHAGRVPVGPDCTVAGHPQCFVIGDLACHRDDAGAVLPGLAPVAMQQGDYVARLIRCRLSGSVLPPFRYRDHGSMAVIGKGVAVARIGTFTMSGALAWWSWLFIHLMSLVAFENRMLVLIQWAWYYWTWNSNARLILDVPSPSESAEPPKPPSA